MKLTTSERNRLEQVLAPYINDRYVQSMSRYVQHGAVTTLDHSKSVAEVSWWLAQRLPLRFDERTLAVGALLHDFYLYDWHGSGWRHSYRHAARACYNATRRFGIDASAQHVIRSHMWPIGITHVPRSREAIVVTLADKFVSLHETLFQRKRRKKICG